MDFGRLDPDPRREPKYSLCFTPSLSETLLLYVLRICDVLICTEPDPQIRTNGLRTRRRIRFLLFFSVAFSLLGFSLLLTDAYFGYIYTSLVRKQHGHDAGHHHKTVEIKVFLNLLLVAVDVRIQIRSREAKKPVLRIRGVYPGS
jgi:hypothetical protein